MHELTVLIGYEASRDLATKSIEVTTPSATGSGDHLDQSCAIVPILRSGLGMSEAMLELLPNAAVHHIGMFRLKGSDMPVQYYNRLPKDGCADVAYVLDPLIRSGITVSATVNQLKKWGCKKIVVVAIIATDVGVALLNKDHPDVSLYVASATDTMVDGKVVPGMGDSGDRQFFSAEMNSDPNDITLSGANTKTQKRKH